MTMMLSESLHLPACLQMELVKEGLVPQIVPFYTEHIVSQLLSTMTVLLDWFLPACILKYSHTQA